MHPSLLEDFGLQAIDNERFVSVMYPWEPVPQYISRGTPKESTALDKVDFSCHKNDE